MGKVNIWNREEFYMKAMRTKCLFFFKSQEFGKRGTHLKKAVIKDWESLNILETH